MSNFIQITPFMQVEDLEKALIFFNDFLGFATQFRSRDYAYIHGETAGMPIVEHQGGDAAPPATARFAYPIDVRDVDRLYAELKPKLDPLATRDVNGPVNQPSGQGELPVLAPDGKRIGLAQAMETAKTQKLQPPPTVPWSVRFPAARASGVYSARCNEILPTSAKWRALLRTRHDENHASHSLC